MRTSVVAAALVFAFLTVVASIAAAAPLFAIGPCEERLMLEHGGIDFPALPLVDSADVILVLLPHADITTIAPVEGEVVGDIERVEKGTAPRTIIYTANTFGASVRAGVRVKLFLKRFADRDAHYIVGTLPPEMLPRAVGVSVSATSYGDPARMVRVGSSILLEVVVTPRSEAAAAAVIVDAYAGLRRPNGDTVWISGTPLVPTLVESATPVPFLAGVPGKRTAIGVTYPVSETDPEGWYTLFAVVVSAGADPTDPCAWRDVASFPLQITHEPSLITILF